MKISRPLLRLINQIIGSVATILCCLSLNAQSQSTWDMQQNQQDGGTDCSNPIASGSGACRTQIPTSPASGNATGSMQQRSSGEMTAPGQLPPDTSYTDEGNSGQRIVHQTSRPKTPEPLSEYQKFVALTTGTIFPIFGENLFESTPSTFAPLDLTPVPPDYAISVGDEVRIRVWGQINFKANLRVDRAGEIFIPQVGGIHVAGLTFSSLDQHLRDAVGRVYRNFDLTADVGQISAVQVYVTGEARRPGLYTVSSLSTLVDALFVSGGPSVEGSMRHIELHRGGTVIADFDLYGLLVLGDKSKDVRLSSGDVIFIPAVGPQVAIIGSVRHPAIYELKKDETVGDAVKDAGGASAVAAEARISIERIHGHETRTAFEVSFDATGVGLRLSDGDILHVLSIVPAYKKTVTLRGNTSNPGRFGWHAGMRVSDLIPDRDSLITRDYWWKRSLLGIPVPEFDSLESFPNLHQPSGPVNLLLSQQYLAATGQTGAANIDEAQRQQAAALQTQFPNAEVNGQNLTPAQAHALGMNSSVANARASDVANNNSALASQRSEVVTQNTAAPSQKTDVRLTSPEIDWDYAVIERTDPETLKTSLIPFDLGKLVMEHDPSQNLELQPGDVVTVFSQADIHVPLKQQTKFVRLEGEFLHSGVYSVLPGETLRGLVQRAGGLTSSAYLYGSEFTRESTRIAQQHRLDEYVRNLDVQIQRGSLALAVSAVSTPQDIASASAAENTEHELIGQLRQMRATGRIVLELKSGSNGGDALPEIELEDGDRFAVPSAPATVNVVGSVYDQGSFLYERDRRVADYVRLAGGPNRIADVRHTFIIRADGSVVSRGSTNGIMWTNTFEQLRLFPGDTIVLPEKTIRPSALRGFLDWSQIFSQLALGAAAIDVLR